MNSNILVALIVVAAVFLVCMGIVFWGVFRKLGYSGLVGLIPGLNLYILYKKCWITKSFFALAGCAIAIAVLHIPTMLTALGVKFKFMWLGDPWEIDPGPKFRVLLIMFGAGLAVVVLALIFGLCIETSMKFQKKSINGLWLFLLPIIFGFILAFDGSQYKEKEEEAVYVALDKDNPDALQTAQ